MKITLQIITLVCIILFVYTATTKLLDFNKFTIQIAQSSLLNPVAEVLAVVIPLFEIGIAVLLIIPRLRYIGLLAFTGMMLVFTGYIVWASYFTPDKPCSCGGVLESIGWIEHLIFNVVFVFIGFGGIYFSWKIRKEACDTEC